MIWIAIVLATLAIQVPNIWAINKFSENPSIGQACVIALACIPTSYIATAGYAFFYGKGFDQYSYPVLAISAYGISLLTAFVVQAVVLQEKDILWTDIVAAGLVLMGLAVMIFRKELTGLI